MVSDAARTKQLLSRRRTVGRLETVLLSLAATALALGAAAWMTEGNQPASYASAALPSGSSAGISFSERFQSLAPAPGDRLHPAVSLLQFKLRDAKALLAQQLISDDWRSTLSGDDRAQPEDSRTSQRADVPMPRSRPVQADFAAQIASSQAYAETTPRADNRSFFEKFSDKIKLASLTPDSGLFHRGPDLAALGYEPGTAVYDISAKAVYLPSGVALEAHSGMGPMMDDPAHVDQRMVGATPPAIYELKPREKLFHGVRALRMTPIEGTSALGRVGLLTHSYMLGPRGDSNGCVSIRFYDRFLKAYENGEINRLVVVRSLNEAATASRRAFSTDS
jgi:hypothetical protein